MPEYISREAAHRMVNQLPRYTWSSPVSTDYCVAVSKDAVLFGLNRIPAADVAPVVHAKWVPFHSQAAGDIQYCSACDVGFDAPMGFCPHCGARMDGVAE